jgi:hypothetical protein
MLSIHAIYVILPEALLIRLKKRQQGMLKMCPALRLPCDATLYPSFKNEQRLERSYKHAGATNS